MPNKLDLSSYIVDWREGSVYHSDKNVTTSTHKIVTITFCGDWGPRLAHVAALRKDVTQFYGEISKCTASSDLTIINIEFPVHTGGASIIKEGPTWSVEPDLFNSLSDLSCNVACLANNHVMDFGEQGLQSTVQTLRQLGIQTVGAGANLEESRRPLLQEINGLKLALINVAEGEEAKASATRAGAAPLDVEFVCSQVSDLSKIVDVAIVVIHAGREFVPVPPPYIQAVYRAIADAGATMIVAHHPHVPQGMEVWKNVPIFYSQGNFALLNRRGIAEYRTLGYLVQATFAKTGIQSVQIIPYKIEGGGLQLLQGEARSRFLEELSRISTFLDPASLATIWDAYADLWMRTKMSSEFKKILKLMSWQDLFLGVTERLRDQDQQRTRFLRLIFRSLASGLQRVSAWLPNQSPSTMKPAAFLRNRFDTLAHRELYLTGLQRFLEGRTGDSATWAQDLLTRWRVLE
jgi:poly-gamma-glutamate capsule biosynthesis protein CapA/YwtB (metallophosphatase superfamily)